MTHGVDRDIALALSAGGYRAAHFHLGVSKKLDQFEQWMPGVERKVAEDKEIILEVLS